MSEPHVEAVGGLKVHPLDREMLPEDPLELQAFEVPGDTELMFRVVIEELARMGWGLEEIVGHAQDPYYQILHGLLQLHGATKFREKTAAVLRRVGVMRVRAVVAPAPDDLVQLTLDANYST